MQNFARIIITKKGELHAKGGHPWVFEGEVLKILPPTDCENTSDYTPASNSVLEDGTLVNVFSRTEEKPCYIGTGFYNSASKIRVRIISTNANDRFDGEFWKRRVKYALDYRKTVMGEDFHSCRLIYGESDLFPGLVVDLFENVLVSQVLSRGIERIKDVIFAALRELLPEYGINIHAIYERNDVNIREKEGMAEYKSWYWRDDEADESGHVLITENGIKYDVDYIEGQKTGYFLDQKYNRKAAAKLAKGMVVLDCFTHTGAFALNIRIYKKVIKCLPD